MKWKERAIRQILFNCKRCGTCCQRPGVVDIYPMDAARLVKRLRLTSVALARKHLKIHPSNDGRVSLKNVAPCEFYENGCRIYLSRPLICRMYPYLAGPTMYCEISTEELPEIDDQDVVIRLAKATNLTISEVEAYLKYIGAFKDGRFV